MVHDHHGDGLADARARQEIEGPQVSDRKEFMDRALSCPACGELGLKVGFLLNLRVLYCRLCGAIIGEIKDRDLDTPLTGQGGTAKI